MQKVVCHFLFYIVKKEVTNKNDVEKNKKVENFIGVLIKEQFGKN